MNTVYISTAKWCGVCVNFKTSGEFDRLVNKIKSLGYNVVSYEVKGNEKVPIVGHIVKWFPCIIYNNEIFDNTKSSLTTENVVEWLKTSPKISSSVGVNNMSIGNF